MIEVRKFLKPLLLVLVATMFANDSIANNSLYSEIVEVVDMYDREILFIMAMIGYSWCLFILYMILKNQQYEENQRLKKELIELKIKLSKLEN